jgi:hypothetical protein
LRLLHLEGQRRADMVALEQAKRANNTMELVYRMELPPQLADIVAGGTREGLVEVPATADVPMLKRFFMYGAHNKLVPPLQVGAGDARCCKAHHHAWLVAWVACACKRRARAAWNRA